VKNCIPGLFARKSNSYGSWDGTIIFFKNWRDDWCIDFARLKLYTTVYFLFTKISIFESSQWKFLRKWTARFCSFPSDLQFPQLCSSFFGVLSCSASKLILFSFSMILIFPGWRSVNKAHFPLADRNRF